MSEITVGWRSVLSHPLVYEAVQYLVGAKKGQRDFLARFVKPLAGERVIDIGCGPAEIIRFLPKVDYCGFDHSAPYIERARKAFGDRARFFNCGIDQCGALGLESFDLALSVGVLHHIDDALAHDLFRNARAALGPNGRLFTADPCYFPGQNPINRKIISLDRGQNVRPFDAYLELARPYFPSVRAHLVNGLLPFPHSVCVLECRKAEE